MQNGAVRKPHLPGVESVYLFLEFTIMSLIEFLYRPLGIVCETRIGVNLSR